MASWARRPVVGALVAFIIVAILAPTVLLIHELLSLRALWVTVFFAIVPVAPLALVLLQAGSRHTATGAGTVSGSASDSAPGPQGPVEWSDSGAPGRQRRGLAHESLSEVFHRVVSLWATFRGTTR